MNAQKNFFQQNSFNTILKEISKKVNIRPRSTKLRNCCAEPHDWCVQLSCHCTMQVVYELFVRLSPALINSRWLKITHNEAHVINTVGSCSHTHSDSVSVFLLYELAHKERNETMCAFDFDMRARAWMDIKRIKVGGARSFPHRHINQIVRMNCYWLKLTCYTTSRVIFTNCIESERRKWFIGRALRAQLGEMTNYGTTLLRTINWPQSMCVSAYKIDDQ